MKITIGGFDGMHLAHQELLKRAEFLVVIEKGSNLTPGLDRCEYTTLPCRFFILEEIKNLSALEFIEILKKMGTKSVVIGEDFRFGKNRSGNTELLKKFFEVEIVKEIKIDGIGVHSNVIREFIKKGEIKRANRFLGHTYKIKGLHIKGQGLGSREFVPTINIQLLKTYVLPKDGVYLSKTNGYNSVTFIGKRSTDENFSIETHILDNNWKIADNPVKIEFLDFIRENRKFNSFEELKRAIQKDIKTARILLEQKH